MPTFQGFPFVIHKGLPVDYVISANHIIVFHLDKTANPPTFVVWDGRIQTTWSTSTLDNAKVGISDGQMYSSGALSNSGSFIVGAGITGETSKNEKTLNAIDAVLEGKATADLQSYTVAGRQVTKMSVEDLLRLRARYATLVAQEKSSILGRKSQANTFKNIIVR